VLEQVRGLAIDLQRIVIIEQVDVEGLHHTLQVYYKRLRAGHGRLAPVDEKVRPSKQ
jgi:hypothetical protein